MFLVLHRGSLWFIQLNGVSSLFLQECGQLSLLLGRNLLHWRATPSPKLTSTEQWYLEDSLGTRKPMTHMCLIWRHGYGGVCVTYCLATNHFQLFWSLVSPERSSYVTEIFPIQAFLLPVEAVCSHSTYSAPLKLPSRIH